MEKNADIIVIINPNASKGKGKTRHDQKVKSFEKRGVFPDYAVTKRTGDARNIAKEAAEAGYNEIIAAGGDGTVNEVLNGIMRSGKDVSMGVIPIGRGNDFAWVAGIPVNIDDAVSLILDSAPRRIDAGYLEGGNAPDGRYFFNGAGVGFEPYVTFKASTYTHLNGLPSYFVAFCYCLAHIPYPYHLSLTIDDRTLRLETQQISVLNGRRMGSTFIMTPDAILNDGKLDVMYSKRPVGRAKVVTMVMSLIRGTVNKNKLLAFNKSENVKIVSDMDDLVIHADGEVISHGCRECMMRICPEAVRLHYTSFSTAEETR